MVRNQHLLNKVDLKWFSTILEFLSLLAILVYPWLICQDCGATPFMILLRLFGIAVGAVVCLVTVKKHFSKNNLIKPFMSALQITLTVALTLGFIVLLHLRTVSLGAFEFCSGCKLFWLGSGLWIFSNFELKVIRFIPLVFSIGALSLASMQLPPIWNQWAKIYQFISLPPIEHGLRTGSVAPSSNYFSKDGTYILWSACPPCHAKSLETIKTFLKENQSQMNLIIFAQTGFRDASLVKEINPNAQIIQLNETEAKRVFKLCNISIRTYPYILIIKDRKVSEKSRFCDGTLPTQENKK